MCLTCSRMHPVISGKENIANLFSIKSLVELFKESDKNVTEEQIRNLSKYNQNILHLHNSKTIVLNKEQILEIIENAAGVIATGVDTQVDIWAIQWKYEYECKTIK